MPKTFQKLPLWQNFAKFGHTGLRKSVLTLLSVCVCVYGKESMIVFRLKAEPRDRESERSIENGVKLEKDAGGFIYTHWLQGILFMILVHLRSY